MGDLMLPPRKRLTAIAEFLTLVALASTLAWAWVETKGDNRWATKTLVQTLATNQAVLIAQLKDHREDRNVHMTDSERKLSYVTREEYTLTHTWLIKLAESQERNWEEQRKTNMIILERLPPK